MKPIPSKHTTMDSTGRDAIIGGALGSALAGTAPAGPCPTAGQMAAFLDGNVAPEEKDRFLAHLAVCDRCREIHVLARELGRTEFAEQGRRPWFVAGGAVAAAALMILALKLAIHEPAPSGRQVARESAPLPQVALAPSAPAKPYAAPAHDAPPHPSRPVPFAYYAAARLLAHAATPDDLAAAVGAPASGSYGFAAAGSRQGTAFRAGKELFELELWLAAGDRERAGLAGERLAPLLRSIGGGPASARLDEVLRNLATDAGLSRYGNIASQLESLLKTGDRGMVRLGGWAAAARLANGVGADPYFAGNPPQRFLEELGGAISPAAQDVLKNLDKKRTGNNPEQMGRLLDDLAKAM